ncbi:uncharacterized protein LOC123718839 isoform X1 [Pieris brassicae]|uniref:uncharacterized protein LOC123718839 isoform X1 n=1 Tax=Pieris brassicae TaxID=7116 RepID=UPI001E660A3E|nr:uncharacterized protein LOC123718839 isoform X1 [Pieris brassicae]
MASLVGFAGVASCTQAAVQIVMSALSLAQYFCVIDFLQDLPELLYIKILYYHNPAICGQRVNIGQSITELSNQAFVLIRKEPFTATRTLYINCVHLGLGVLWFFSSVILIASWSSNKRTPTKWPWIVTTIGICALDVVAIVIFANDVFFTRTLNEIMNYIGATASGLGNTVLDTRLAVWIMIALYGRLGVFFLFNIVVLIVVAVKKREVIVMADNISEAPSTTKLFARRDTPNFEDSVSTTATSYDLEVDRIPRPTLTSRADPEMDKKVKFIADIINPPVVTDNKENIIQERRHSIDISVVGTAAYSQPSTSSMQPLPAPEKKISKKPSTAELHRQLPWSYLPSTSQPMRSQLPPDEDLPPVPLPDYTVIHNPRKASVHRAPSNLGSPTVPRIKFPTSVLTSGERQRQYIDDVLPKVFMYYTSVKSFLSSRWFKNPRLLKIKH